MKKIFAIAAIALFTISCKDKKKNEEVKEDVRQRMENVGDKIDTTLDKVKDRLKEIKDTVKSRIHRATAPDSNQ